MPINMNHILANLIIDGISSSCHAANTDLPNPLLLPVSIVQRSREVFPATSCIVLVKESTGVHRL